MRAATHTTPGCLACGRGTVVLCPSKRVLYPPCRFGSTVRATGTKGLINKSNESINIQTVSERERGRKRASSTRWRTTLLPPSPVSPCNGNLLFSTEPCRLYLLLCDAQEIGTSELSRKGSRFTPTRSKVQPLSPERQNVLEADESVLKSVSLSGFQPE